MATVSPTTTPIMTSPIAFDLAAFEDVGGRPLVDKYLQLHRVTACTDEDKMCVKCNQASAEYALPFVLCKPCMAAFVYEHVARSLLDEIDGESVCTYCLRRWNSMDQADRGELEDVRGNPICNRCDLELHWPLDRCASCDKHDTAPALSVQLPWLEFVVCSGCVDENAKNARFRCSTDRCLWCQREGEGSIVERSAAGKAMKRGEVCAEHAYQRFFSQQRRNRMIDGHARWVADRYPHVRITGITKRIVSTYRKRTRKSP